MELNQASQTDWNGGTLTNIRLHSMREEIKFTAITRDLVGWLSLLQQMNHELYGFQTPEEKKRIRKKLEELAEKINQYQLIKTRTKKQVGIPAIIIDELNEMQYTLDEVFHKSGLQTRVASDARHSFG